MRLKVIDTQCESQTEADYETAVKMLSWSVGRRRTLLGTSAGVRLVVETQQEVTSRILLEPNLDTDAMRDAGAPVYLERRDPESTVRRETKTLHGLYIARPVEPITREQFRAVFATPSLGIDATAWEVYFNEQLEATLRERVAVFLAGGDGRPATAGTGFTEALVRPTIIASHGGEGDVTQLAQAIPDIGTTVDCSLSSALESAIRLAEALHASIEATNHAVTAENRVAAALARLDVFIDRLAADASFQVHLGFRAERPRTVGEASLLEIHEAIMARLPAWEARRQHEPQP